ncbi:MAG: nucleotidyltransferase family protein [Leptospira sp.]|nr:nucleotidyltransferase family protein [Leptospira sp.]
MKALLLAAGFGTRLRPVTDRIPKCLVPINGKPLLEIWLELLEKADLSGIIVNLHYLPEKVINFLDNSKFKNRVTTVYEKELLGTAGTLLSNRQSYPSEAVILIHADNLSQFDIIDFIQSHNKRPIGCEITMMTFKTDLPKLCGIVESDAENRLIGFYEKVENPPGNLANGAVYIVEPSVIQFLISLNKEVIDFSTEVIPNYLGRIFLYENNTYHRDIGNLESYAIGQREYQSLPKI